MFLKRHSKFDFLGFYLFECHFFYLDKWGEIDNTVVILLRGLCFNGINYKLGNKRNRIRNQKLVSDVINYEFIGVLQYKNYLYKHCNGRVYSGCKITHQSIPIL